MENKIRLYNDIDLLSFNSEDDKLNIEGYAAHFGTKNLNDEIVYKESFDLFFETYNKGQICPVLNYEHQDDKQIGGIDSLEIRNEGLYMKGHLNKTIPYVNEWLIPNIMAGDVNKLSTEGICVGGMNGIKVNDDGTYVVLNFLLTAVAVVKHPADWKAEFTVKNYLESLKKTDEEVKEELNKSKWYLL